MCWWIQASVLMVVTLWDGIKILCNNNNNNNNNSNEKPKKKFGNCTRKTLYRFTTKDSCTWNITHNTESTAVWSLKREWWGSPLVQDKYRGEKACESRHTYCIIIITAIEIQLGGSIPYTLQQLMNISTILMSLRCYLISCTNIRIQKISKFMKYFPLNASHLWKLQLLDWHIQYNSTYTD